MRRVLVLVLEAAGWSAVALAALVVMLQLVGTPHRWISIIQALTPWFAVPAVVVALVAASTDRVALGLSSAIVALTICALGLPLVLTGRGPAPVGDARLTVMTANVLYTNDRIDEIADAIARVDPDIVSLNEVTPAISRTLRSHPLAASYPYRREEPGDLAAGLSMWSKYPLDTAGAVLDLPRGIDTTAATPLGPVRMVSVHPPPPLYDLTTWAAELDALPDVTAASEEATIVLGDFNSSWFHPPFRRAVRAAGLRDAAAADGRGLSMTWPIDRWVPAFVALDHVLVDERFAVVDTRTVELPGSDHAGVVAVLGPSG